MSTDPPTEERPNPFELLAPTRNNFPNIAAALVYYEARLQTCRYASGLLRTGANLTHRVIETSEAAADATDTFLKSAEAARVLPEAFKPEQLRALASKCEPVVLMLADEARKYEERGELLERTIAALLAALPKDENT